MRIDIAKNLKAIIQQEKRRWTHRRYMLLVCPFVHLRTQTKRRRCIQSNNCK